MIVIAIVVTMALRGPQVEKEAAGVNTDTIMTTTTTMTTAMELERERARGERGVRMHTRKSPNLRTEPGKTRADVIEAIWTMNSRL